MEIRVVAVFWVLQMKELLVLMMSCLCQMTRQKQLRNEFDVFYSGGNSPWIGSVQCLTSSGIRFPRDVGQERVLASEEATQKQAMID